MKNKYLLWIGLIVWFPLSTIIALIGFMEIAEVLPVIGVMILCVYGIRRCDEKKATSPKQKNY